MKRYFVTGLLIWVPLGITLWVLNLLIGTLDQSLLLLPAEWLPEAWLGMRIPGLGVILTALVILVTGVFAANFFGQKLIDWTETLFSRIPVVKSIYGSVKQVSDTLFSGKGHAFRKVLLVRYPHPQAWALAFQTNVPPEVLAKLPEDHVAVFIPTTPSPVNGFYFYVKKSEAIELDMPVDRALKYIVSMGVASGDVRTGTQTQ
ncbi:MAG: hypothetical protein ABS91_02460 [Thiobacillus sp. SCN 64-35]|jgi:uncharacterized membrane protein|nr:DUF502 domain-containing protein [Betaproteobacteria bacterium SCN1]MBN8761640.1 DUF502 domain-containing protein [Thiobacillus sp.]ODU11332.1 MAG: hypothetical protein ABS91_02460 [Thiobacillus sp. SCN 64-35]ODU87325.1 MAG: hypothetical protein ABT21_13845 [Thiobacillus sp. SCN 65-179]OJW37230.1 MAG: hypothetical protein BGO61_09535 [Thiobacillus sp. 65-69]